MNNLSNKKNNQLKGMHSSLQETKLKLDPIIKTLKNKKTLRKSL